MVRIPRPLRLPERLRRFLGGVHGKVIMSPLDIDLSRLLVSVGDVCSVRLMEAGIRPDMIVVDMQTKRGEMIPDSVPCDRLRKDVANPAGWITPELCQALEEVLPEVVARKRGVAVVIDGEEDLAVIPVILTFPEGTQIVYGVPDLGMAMLIITSGLRSRAQEILETME